MKLNAKIALITGGTGALGQAVCNALLAEGAKVVTTFRQEEEFLTLKKNLGKAFQGFQTDVADEKSMADLVKKIIGAHKRIDILINLVGGFAGGKILETSAEQMDKMYNINLKTMFIATRAVLPQMMAQNSGKIISVGSVGLLRGHTAGAGTYLAAKAGVVSLTQALAEELADYEINVNAILPGTMDTPANRRDMPKVNFADWARVEDVARVILFLCSDDSKAVKGALIPVVGLR